MIDILRLLPRYLLALLAVAGHILVVFFLSGWAWFREYFATLGLDADISHDGLLSRIEAYIPQGIDSLSELFKGTFNNRLGDLWAQSIQLIRETQARYLVYAILVMLILYFIPAAVLGWRAPDTAGSQLDGDGTPQSNSTAPPRGSAAVRHHQLLRLFQTATYVAVIFLSVSAAILALKVGQWHGEHSAKSISQQNLPRVQLLFKSGSSSSAIAGLDQHVLRKLFADKSNLYVYSEKDLVPGMIPPIYVISINEISQMRVLPY